MSRREVVPVAVDGADGLPLLAPLRRALSGVGPVLVPHARGAVPGDGASQPLREGEDDASDPLTAVVSTTGSSGRAKPVMLQASALLASAAATHDRLGGAGRWLLAVPAHTVAGLQVLVRSLVAGTEPTVVDLSAGFTAQAFTSAAGALLAAPSDRFYVSFVPTQLSRLLDAGPLTTDLLVRFDAVLVGGAALSDSLRARATEAGVRVVSTYGMTETAGGCVYDGVALPGVTVRIDSVRIDSAPIYTERIDTARTDTARTDTARTDTARTDTAGSDTAGSGRVLLSGPVLSRGYRHSPGQHEVRGPGVVPGTASSPSGEGFVVEAGTRWFRTADAGRLEAGVLAVHGRLDDVVVSGGSNVSLTAVERVVQALTGVHSCVAVGLDDPAWGQRVGVVLEPSETRPGEPLGSRARPGPPEWDERVQAAVRRELGRAAVPSHVVVTRVPMLGVGKPDRRAARTLLQAPTQHERAR